MFQNTVRRHKNDGENYVIYSFIMSSERNTSSALALLLSLDSKFTKHFMENTENATVLSGPFHDLQITGYHISPYLN